MVNSDRHSDSRREYSRLQQADSVFAQFWPPILTAACEEIGKLFNPNDTIRWEMHHYRQYVCQGQWDKLVRKEPRVARRRKRHSPEQIASCPVFISPSFLCALTCPG